MTPEAAAAVMAERSAVCSLLSNYDFGPEYTRDRMERAVAAIRARPAPVVEPAEDGDPAMAAYWRVISRFQDYTQRDVGHKEAIMAYIVAADFKADGRQTVMRALRSIETIASQDGDTFRDFMRPTERMEHILRTARAALADLQRAEG